MTSQLVVHSIFSLRYGVCLISRLHPIPVPKLMVGMAWELGIAVPCRAQVTRDFCLDED